jgi:hypothetical protein
MKYYKVEYSCKLSYCVTVEADSEEEAIAKAEDIVCEEHLVDSDGFELVDCYEND